MKKAQAPEPVLESTSSLLAESAQLTENAQLLQQRFSALAAFRKYLSVECYGFVKWEIDARLSAMNHYWMEHQHTLGQVPPEAVINLEQARSAFDWFMNQEFKKESMPELRQRYLKMLLDNFPIERRGEILEELLQRACGLTAISKSGYEDFA